MRVTSWGIWEKCYPGCSAAWDVRYPQGKPVISINHFRTCGWGSEIEYSDHLYLYDGDDVLSYHEQFQIWCKTWMIPVDSCWHCYENPSPAHRIKIADHVHSSIRLAGIGWAIQIGLINAT